MPGHLLTVDEYAALDGTGFTELVEGRVVPSPSSGRRHDMAVCLLAAQLERQLPRGLAFVVANDVDLGLSPDDGPGFARRPDLLVVDRAAFGRADRLFQAKDVVLVAEVVAPGSRRTDYRVKRDEYADAGIPHYWIVDLAEPVSLVACRSGECGYVDAPAATGTFAVDVPFPVRLDLADLIP